MKLLIATAVVLVMALMLNANGKRHGEKCREEYGGHHPNRYNPCCAPTQWETDMGFVKISSGQTTKGFLRVYYDYRNQRLAINETVVFPGGDVLYQLILADGSTHKAYVVDLASKHCSVSPFESVSLQCVPSDFTYDTTVILGDPRQSVSSIVFNGGVGSTNYSLTVTQKLCAPISQLATTPHNVSALSFFNFTLGIKNTGIFNVPPECKSSSAVPSKNVTASACLNTLLLNPCF